MRANLLTWNEFVAKNPGLHVLQCGAWGELKSAFGWKPFRFISDYCGVQVLFRSIPGGRSIGYIPKAMTNLSNELLTEIDQICLEEKAVFLKIEPDQWESDSVNSNFSSTGWTLARPFQPQRTVMISLEGSGEDILSRMKQKTRYNIRLAEKKGIQVRNSTDISTFHLMSEITAKRDGFSVHSQAYYQKALDLFSQNQQAALLLAYYENTPVAGLIVFYLGKRAYYMYGASTNQERNRMPAYLLQWEAMKWARDHGCVEYDLWGIPDLQEEDLEDEFIKKESHAGLWGVYRFKRGFGGEVKRSVGAWDKIYSRGFYTIYQALMRLRGRTDS